MFPQPVKEAVEFSLSSSSYCYYMGVVYDFNVKACGPALIQMIKLFLSPLMFFLIVVPFQINAGACRLPNGEYQKGVSPSANFLPLFQLIHISIRKGLVWIMVISFQVSS